MAKNKIIVVGGGFAGLNVLNTLKNADVDILLLDKTNHHLFQPLLYQVATSALSSADIAAPLRDIFKNQKNASVLLIDVVKVDKHNKTVSAACGETFSYDYLVLAPGSNHSYFNHPEWEQFAPGLKNLNDANQIRDNIIMSFEKAERATDSSDSKKFMTFVIIGGGPTGVEMAGAIAELAHYSLNGNFKNIDPRKSSIYLIEGVNQVLPIFPQDLASKAKGYLEKMGVQVLLNTTVTDINEKGVWLGNRLIETSNIIWAAGNQASPILKFLDVPLDKFNRVIVEPDLSIPGYPEIFVIGDAACSIGIDEKPLPGFAPVAIQQGKYVGKIIKKQIPKKDRKPFVYFDKGLMATVGSGKAIAMSGKIKLSGFIAWLAWSMIHIIYLVTFSNRLFVSIKWFYLYLMHKRKSKIIVGPIK
ncbi:MAG: NAD(P)/FAD-dependent oxidoreductase [Parachlamydiaceae bacterium]|nr:NAD(P)/FAD-dependent oxidoreductase [Parachlamydiaceae bacterium]